MNDQDALLDLEIPHASIRHEAAVGIEKVVRADLPEGESAGLIAQKQKHSLGKKCVVSALLRLLTHDQRQIVNAVMIQISAGFGDSGEARWNQIFFRQLFVFQRDDDAFDLGVTQSRAVLSTAAKRQADHKQTSGKDFHVVGHHKSWLRCSHWKRLDRG